MRTVRYIISIICAAVGLVFGVSAFTVPAFAATPYLIMAIVCAVAAWLFWPKRRKNPEAVA